MQIVSCNWLFVPLTTRKPQTQLSTMGLPHLKKHECCYFNSIHGRTKEENMDGGEKNRPMSQVIRFSPCGFVLNPNAPHLGCKPGLQEIQHPNNGSYKSCPKKGRWILFPPTWSWISSLNHGTNGAELGDLFTMCKDDFHFESPIWCYLVEWHKNYTW